MFRLIVLIIALVSFFSVTVKASEDSKISAGSMHFYGSVVNASCAINADSLHQNVILGEVRASNFTGPGAWANDKTFWIKLENCTSTTSQFARVAFTGQVNASDPQVFNAGFGADAVKGVGIGIFDDKGNLIVPNSAPRSATEISEGQTVLLFTAKYRSVAATVVPGEASAAINFSIIYQ
ncbi:TPA: fimbrial protein [Enterobacter cancerogenus]|nr:fimbrial protein [Enterobacter cancerogenus]